MSEECPPNDRRQPAQRGGLRFALPSIWRPSSEQIARFLARQRQCDFTYGAVGATATQPPTGFRIDHTRCQLGQGEAVFAAACDALRRWQQFGLSWLNIAPPGASIEPGEVVAIVARAAGVWLMNPCRIVYVIDEVNGAGRRFGFAYGTLPGHAGCGEERFLVEMQPGGDVAYDILAFSRPGHLLARLGYPLMRRYQRRFGRESAAAMRQAVVAATQPESGVTR